MGRIVAAWLTAAALISNAQVKQPDYVLRSEVRLVRLLTTVKDPAGNLIGDLSKDDFKITDNGVPQEIAVFERTTSQPLSVSLMVDTSASTATHLKNEMDSVHRFLRALFQDGNTQDRAALYSFSWQVVLEMSFTRNLGRLESALRRLTSHGGTAVYDAMQLAARNLEDRDGRHVIIIVTDGGDTVSSVKFGDALEAAQRANAVIYPILIVPITNGAGRNTGGEHALETFAAETGGKVFAASIGSQLDKAFDNILRDLRSQYLLGYYPANIPRTKDKFHRVKVETPSRSGLRISTRSGYYGDAAP
ncbi:MAG: VWA domain-containing protein [Acidobacteria bacterium]|nr:VWA domain-containing protein [Acidobacteriota bacterium]